MKNFQNKKTLQIVLVVLIAVITLGIGYASISAINLIINGNATASVDQNNFDVHFVSTSDTPSLSGNVTPTGSASISQQDNKVALFDVGGMTKVGDYVIATYTVINESNGIGADITLKVTNTNSEYFKVTETISDSQLQAGDTTTGTIKVEMIKTPIDTNVTTSVTGTLTATPIENTDATGNSSVSKEKPTAFERDSWSTIKTNVQNGNTSQYNVGDTKEVTINNVDYTVRIANKTIHDWCENEAYSQTACGFVVEFADIITTMKMRIVNTNQVGWRGSDLHAYLEGDLYNSLQSDLKAVIEPTRVISGYGDNGVDSSNFTTVDNLYLLSGVEVFGNDDYDTASGTTTQLDYYVNMPSEEYEVACGGCGAKYEVYPRTIKQYNSSDTEWWLRSAHSNTDSGFRIVYSNGNLSYYNAYYTCGVSPAFRIG